MSVSKPVGVWILAVALSCFAAGLVAGFAVPELLAAPRALRAKRGERAGGRRTWGDAAAELAAACR